MTLATQKTAVQAKIEVAVVRLRAAESDDDYSDIGTWADEIADLMEAVDAFEWEGATDDTGLNRMADALSALTKGLAP